MAVEQIDKRRLQAFERLLDVRSQIGLVSVVALQNAVTRAQVKKVWQEVTS